MSLCKIVLDDQVMAMRMSPRSAGRESCPPHAWRGHRAQRGRRVESSGPDRDALDGRAEWIVEMNRGETPMVSYTKGGDEVSATRVVGWPRPT